MNDRGLSLTSTEMLKGYILSEIRDDSIREKMNGLWKDMVLLLKKDDDKGDETFIKAWLRAHYAETIRDTKAGAVNKDFDIIGGSFHKWVRDEREKLGLVSSDDFEQFIRRFAKFAEVYLRIRQAETVFSEETKSYLSFRMPHIKNSTIIRATDNPLCSRKLKLTSDNDIPNRISAVMDR